MSKNQLKTVDVTFDKETEMVKPRELIEWLGAENLTLTDRRRFNIMLLNAWPSISEDETHEVPKSALRGRNKDNERVLETVRRLMSITPSIEIKHKGRDFTRLFHLLEVTETENTDDDTRGILRYKFTPQFRSIVRNSTQYAQLKKEVIYQLPSKYALALYELIAKRVNLQKTCEVINLETFRAWLGVEKDKLVRYTHFNAKAIKPAVAAVNALAEFRCDVQPVKRGQKVIAITLSWSKKDVFDKAAALREVGGSKVGRSARASGTVERMVAPATSLPPPSWLSARDVEKWREEFPDSDVEYFERKYAFWYQSKGKQPVRSLPLFVAFTRKHIERNKTVGAS